MSKIFLMLRRCAPILINGCLLLLIISACSDFFEKDLTSNKVQLLAPANNLKTSVSNITFWWNPLAGATQYRIQVVSPTFDAAQYLALDSLTSNVTYTYTFVPGKYQWKVLAINGSSISENNVSSFTIDSSGLLSGDKVILYSPFDGFCTRDSIIHFRWFGIPIATGYDFDIRLDRPDGVNVINDPLLQDTIFVHALKEGVYYWKVQAKNDVSASLFTLPRKLVVDTTAPGKPIIIQPTQNNNDTFKLADKKIFTWKHPSDAGSPISDSIIISDDNQFNNYIDASFVDSTTTYESPATYSTGTYYWRVRSIDKALNKSSYSITAKFIVK